MGIAKTRAKLSRQRGITTLFDRRLWAQRLERSFMQIWDVWAAAMPPMHTLVAG
jgi:predicted O-linked N-acetylglucosamine transferase (SPINDLY family)